MIKNLAEKVVFFQHRVNSTRPEGRGTENKFGAFQALKNTSG